MPTATAPVLNRTPSPTLDTLMARSRDEEYYQSSASSSRCSSPALSSSSFDHHDDSKELLASIATLSESQLRAALTRLITTNPLIRRAVVRELRSKNHDRAFLSPNTSSQLLPRVRRHTSNTPRSETTSVCVVCGTRFDDDNNAPEEVECTVHTGELVEEIFEFVSPQGGGNSSQTILMWTCCEEEPGSRGCAAAGAHVIVKDTVKMKGGAHHHKL